MSNFDFDSFIPDLPRETENFNETVQETLLDILTATLHSLEKIKCKFQILNMYKDLKTALDTNEEVQPIQRVLPDSCDVGCFYDLVQDVNKLSKLNIRSDQIDRVDISEKFHVSDPIFTTASDNSHQCCLNVTYTDYKEELNHKNYISCQKNIKDSIYAHFVSCRVMGLQADIKLTASEYCTDSHFQEVVDILLGRGKTLKEEEDQPDVSEIFFSICGKLPLDLKFESEIMDNDSLKYLQTLFKIETYEKLNDKFLLYVEIVPLNMQFYFQPIFEKLVTLDDIESSSSSSGPPNCVINCIKTEILQKVISAAEFIKSGNHYLEITQFLQNLYQSFLLNKKHVDSVIKSFDETVGEEVAILESLKELSSFDKKFPLTILYKGTLPLNKSKNLLQEIISNYFFSNGSQKLNQKQLIHKVQLSFKEDAKICLSKMKEKDLVRMKWETALSKNIEINCEISRSCDLLLNESLVEVLLCKNGIPINPQIPVLEPPLNLRKVETSGKSITIEWTMPLEEDNDVVRCYRIDYRRVEKNSTSRWHSIFSENQKTISTVDDLQSGTVYVFRVQAQFEDFFGVWSEESDGMSTEKFSELSDDYPTELREKIEENQRLEKELNDLKEELKCSVQKNIQKEKIDLQTSSSSPEMSVIIERSINELRKIGSVIRLDENGECHFQLRNDRNDAWCHIVTGFSWCGSRPILLPQELHGLIVDVYFEGYSYDEEEVRIVLSALGCSVNKEKIFPVSVNLQVKIVLLNGEFYTSENHRFTFDSIASSAQPNNFMVSCKNTDREKLPEIILKFSK